MLKRESPEFGQVIQGIAEVCIAAADASAGVQAIDAEDRGDWSAGGEKEIEQ